MASDERRCDASTCFLELQAYVFFLRKICARKQPPFDEVKGRIEGLIEQSARTMRECGIDPRDYDDARFAVFAWIDETLLNMPWSHREEWRRSMLQASYYGTTNAGEEFFERLNRLRPDDKAVRTVYYLCLSLGFRGRYHSDGEAFLIEQLKKSNVKSLIGSTKELNGYGKEELFPGAYETGLGEGGRRRRDSFWTLPRIVLAAAPPIFLILLFLVYNFVLNGVVDNLVAHVGGG